MFSKTIDKASFVTPGKEKIRKEVKDLVFYRNKENGLLDFLNTQNPIISALHCIKKKVKVKFQNPKS